MENDMAALMAVTVREAGKTVDDALLFGDLVMLYSNEEAQRLPLEAHIYHPQLNLHPKVCLPVCPLRARCWVASCRARLC